MRLTTFSHPQISCPSAAFAWCPSSRRIQWQKTAAVTSFVSPAGGSISQVQELKEGIVTFTLFLDASSHLYKMVCPSVCPSVTPLLISRRWRIECPPGLVFLPTGQKKTVGLLIPNPGIEVSLKTKQAATNNLNAALNRLEEIYSMGFLEDHVMKRLMTSTLSSSFSPSLPLPIMH